MPFPFAELTMLVMICTLVCLIVFALAYGEMWLGGSVGIAEGGYSAAWKQSPTLARTAFGGASGAPEPSKKGTPQGTSYSHLRAGRPMRGTAPGRVYFHAN
jgi:hypothetical protein